ncbi:YtxH domain-containing protein [Niallia sp. XMNu-256]|uniref:YtxH domain-containing protein n=1 Tax=Niallia sp. XMNu-256 TaxID=3082444 RepID=UPI0030CE99F0
MEKAEQTKNIKNKNSMDNSAVKRLIGGALIGASVGYIATPENGKKIVESINRDKLLSTRNGISQAVKEKSKNVMDSIKKSAGKISDKKEDVSIEGYSNEQDSKEETETSIKFNTVNDIEEDNKGITNNENGTLNDRFNRLEEMLSKLIEDEANEKTNMNNK